MKQILTASIISSMIIFSGCGSTEGDDNLGVLDDDKPRITLTANPDTGSTDIELRLGDTQIPEYGYIAEDVVDGDLSVDVQRTNDIDLTKVGTYTITYFVEDTDGYTDTKTRTVTIVASNDDYSNGDYSNDEYSDDLSTYNPNAEGNIDLGEQIGSSQGADYGAGIDGFTSWYYDVCNQNFNASLYNAGTGSYNGTITCSNNLNSIDLTPVSIFTTINGLDLSNNNLTYIDFSVLGLNESTNNTKILKSLDLRTNSLNTQNFDLFRPLHYLKDIDKLYIANNNFNYTCDDLYKLRTDKELFNNGSLDIDREREQNCPSLQNK
ncbi:DUF5011 domain-containing protein [Sulfurovum sp. bin170]|uniref:immunoglobulin-like domain-containing protein n=1 Tax=Sulfurovum sp. bin170 TaxID=2695268 RepID=UPI0013DF5901|nr:immunoglobulin-like domain-containing protein [Sulfurovum sp. bin170]NEW59914.1 DUF5011 domain-containing protein [Sulfurovum sp. bin170]